MDHYYLTKKQYEELLKVCDKEEVDMIHAMDSISPDEFWVFYGAPPDVVVDQLLKKLD